MRAYRKVCTRSGLRALFEWDPLLELVSRILGRAPLHRYADPLGAMNLAVMHEGEITGVLERADCTEENIMQLAVGKKIAAAKPAFTN